VRTKFNAKSRANSSIFDGIVCILMAVAEDIIQNRDSGNGGNIVISESWKDLS